MTELEKLIDALEYAQRMALGDVVIYREDINLILDTFDRLQEENERLKNAYKQCAFERDAYIEIENTAISEAKAEAYKEFAERVKKGSIDYVSEYHGCLVYFIDNLLKELVGEQK